MHDTHVLHECVPTFGNLRISFPSDSANHYFSIAQSATPAKLLQPVWPLPRSLATTSGISVDVFSWPYLDVSVQAVPHIRLFDSPYVDW